jgi:hypothetical protein
VWRINEWGFFPDQKRAHEFEQHPHTAAAEPQQLAPQPTEPGPMMNMYIRPDPDPRLPVCSNIYTTTIERDTESKL